MLLSLKTLATVLLVLILGSELDSAILPRRNAKKLKKKTTPPQPPLLLFNELSKGLTNLFNPIQWFQQMDKQVATESPDNVIVDQPLVFGIGNSQTGVSEEYTTGDAKVDKTITQFFGAMTQIMDNMFKSFVTPTMNGTIWDDTPRPNGSGGLANFLSSFFCQIFLGILSPNYNGKKCFVYRYPSTTSRAPTVTTRSGAVTTTTTKRASNSTQNVTKTTVDPDYDEYP